MSGDLERGCVDEQNSEAQVYNSKLQKLIPTLQGSLRGSKIVYLNAYEAFTVILQGTNKYGTFSSNVMIPNLYLAKWTPLRSLILHGSLLILL